MKRNITLMAAALLALSACGSSARLASSGQQFQDMVFENFERISTAPFLICYHFCTV